MKVAFSGPGYVSFVSSSAFVSNLFVAFRIAPTNDSKRSTNNDSSASEVAGSY